MHPRLALAESINFRKCGRCAILLTRDLRDAIAQGNAKARLAVDKFTWTIAKWISSYVAELGGLDMLVFIGGIGENNIASRAEICAGLGALGIVLDAARNNVRAAGSCVHELALFRGTIERSSECILCSEVRSIGVPTLWLMDQCPMGSMKEP